MTHTITHCILLLVCCLLCPPRSMPASLELGASFRSVHEDNVNQLLSGAGRAPAGDDPERPPVAASVSGRRSLRLPGGSREGDRSTIAALNAGASTVAGPGAEVLLLAEFRQFRFSRFTGLDASTAGLRTVLLQQFTDVHSLQASLSAGRAWYDADGMTDSRWGGTAELLQQTASKFWLAEGAQFERRRTRDSTFRSEDKAVHLRTGYRFRELTSVVITYRHLLRGMNSGSRLLVDSLALEGQWEVVRRLQVEAFVEHQRIEADPQATKTGNTIVSAGVAWSY